MRHPNTYQLRTFVDRWYRVYYHCAPDQWLSLAAHIAGDILYRVKEPTDEQIIEAIDMLDHAGVECPGTRYTWSGAQDTLELASARKSGQAREP